MDNAGSLKIAYVSESYGPHDHRFLEAVRRITKDVWHVRVDASARILERRPSPVGKTRTETIVSDSFPARLDALRELFKRIDPDIVHAGPLQRVTFPVVLATNAPVVAASWGSDLIGPAASDAVWRDVAAFSLSRAAGFLGDCNAALQAAQMLGYRGPHARIPWGIDVSLFRPEGPIRRPAAADELVVISTRNWEPIYDVETLAKAFAELEIKAHLVLCGSGSQEGRLRSILARATAGDRVTWAGRVSQNDLPALYRGADLYVSTSMSDGTSVSLLEAMSCAKPVLVSDIAGNREWVEDRECRFPVGDVRALKTALQRFTSTSLEERKVLGQVGRTRILRDADWSKAHEKLARLYLEASA